MGKKTFVEIRRGRRGYKLFSDDIKDVHTAIRKKRPPVPRFECATDDDSLATVENNSQNLMTL